jgi:phenylacetate-coenzyme A ligase PaaK-like adenylate-forming protein
MTSLRIVVEPSAGEPADHLAARVRSTIKERLFFQADIDLAVAGSLPRYELKAHRFIREP